MGGWPKFGERSGTDLTKNILLGVIADALERIAYSLEADQRQEESSKKMRESLGIDIGKVLAEKMRKEVEDNDTP